jgi:dTDP-glucose pyrophosphorylase
MGDLTKDLPKPLLPYQGKPFIQHIIERMIKAGIDEFIIVINPHYQSIFKEKLEQYWSKIQLVYQKFPLGTAHALSLCWSHVNSKGCILTYGDILFSVEDYRVSREDNSRPYRMGINQVQDPYNGCAVYFDQDLDITKIIEKPAKGTSKTTWNGSGLFALPYSIFDDLTNKSPKLFNLHEEWNFTRFFADYCANMALAIPVKEWTHIENQEVYQQLIGEKQ